MDLLSSGPVDQSAGRATDDQILEELGSIPAEVKHFFFVNVRSLISLLL